MNRFLDIVSRRLAHFLPAPDQRLPPRRNLDGDDIISYCDTVSLDWSPARESAEVESSAGLIGASAPHSNCTATLHGAGRSCLTSHPVRLPRLDELTKKDGNANAADFASSQS